MTAGLKEAKVRAFASPRQAYSTPCLARYGPLRCLTTSGTMPTHEGTGNTKNRL